MTEPLLVDREGLRSDVEKLGLSMGERRFAYALRALGVYGVSRPLDPPKRGRTKHYYRETAWAIVALNHSTGGDFDELTNVLEPYREEWDEIEESEHTWWSGWIPGWQDREFGALLLLLVSPDYGLSPQLAVDISQREGALSITSFDRDFINTIIDSLMNAHADWIGRWLRQAKTMDLKRRRDAMSYSFVYAAGQSFEVDAKIRAAIDSGASISEENEEGVEVQQVQLGRG